MTLTGQIPVAARSKEWFYCRSLHDTAVSNPAGGMDARFLRVLCIVRYRSLRGADHPSRGVLLSVVCLSVIMKPR